MFRSRLRNKFIKLKTNESREAYKTQSNYCLSLLRQVKKNFYESLSPSIITDNKMFWKQVKPIFSDRTPSNNKIILLEGHIIISNPSTSAEIFNNCDAVKDLYIDRSKHINRMVNADDPLQENIKMYKNPPSILRIHEEGILHDSFSFLPISGACIHSMISNVDSSKAYQSNNIPPKVFKDNADIFKTVLSSDINNCLLNGIFPRNLKYTDITPNFKKLERLLKINYRPVSILPTLSKIYEKVLYQQMYEYFDKIFSKAEGLEFRIVLKDFLQSQGIVKHQSLLVSPKFSYFLAISSKIRTLVGPVTRFFVKSTKVLNLPLW